MASGVLKTSFHKSGIYTFQIEWSSVPNIPYNRSALTIKVYLISNTSGANIISSVSKKLTSTVGSTSYVDNVSVSLTSNQKRLLASRVVNIDHDSDGKKKINLGAKLDIQVTLSGIYYGTVTIPVTEITLDTIPRASSISTFNNFTIGSNIPIAINRASSSFTHTLQLKFGNMLIATRTGIGASTTLVLTQQEQDALYNLMPKATSGKVTLHCTTYSGNTKIGSTTSKDATATVGSSIKPDFTTISHSDVSSAIANAFNAYIQSKSRLNLAITGAVAGKGSTIKSYSLEFETAMFSSRTATTDYIKGTGSIPIKGTVTDNRGRTASKTVNINALAYAPPKITSLRVDRCDANGTLNPMGQYAKVQISGEYKSLNSKNTGKIFIYSKPRNVSNYTKKKEESVAASFNKSYILSTYDILASFDFNAIITDYFYSELQRIEANVVLGTAKILLDLGRYGLGVGKYHENGDIDIAGDMYIGGVIRLTGGEEFLLTNGADWSGQIYYRKNALGQVTVYGSVSSQQSYPGNMGQLPVGYRPVSLHTCTYSGQEVQAGIEITTDGYLLYSGDSAHMGVNFHTIFSTI